MVNCASGKYRSSPIKLTSLDMSLEHWCRAKSCRCRSYSDQLPPVKFIAWAHPPAFFYHASACKRLGVKSRCGKSQPSRSAQRDLTYTLSLHGIWAQCIVFQEHVFLLRHGAWLAMHPLGINNQVSCSLIHSRSLVRVLRRGVFASSYSNAISTLEVREHPRL